MTATANIRLQTWLSVGFNSISYFNKLFKRYLNCTPTEYRERVANSSNVVEMDPFAIPLF